MANQSYHPAFQQAVTVRSRSRFFSSKEDDLLQKLVDRLWAAITLSIAAKCLVQSPAVLVDHVLKSCILDACKFVWLMLINVAVPVSRAQRCGSVAGVLAFGNLDNPRAYRDVLELTFSRVHACAFRSNK